MTEKQALVYKFIDEWWKMYGFANTILPLSMAYLGVCVFLLFLGD
jgi:hypothetical protein